MKISDLAFVDIASKEWLITNGLGGYAASSIVGANTRRYHGLLVASLQPPTERCVLVSKIDEQVYDINADVFALGTNTFHDVLYPEGYKFAQTFERFPLPSIQYKAGAAVLSKTISMVHGSNTTIVKYENAGRKTLFLRLSPYYVHRDYHSLFNQNGQFDYYYERLSNSALKIHSYYGSPALYTFCDKGSFTEDRTWCERVEYQHERERGLDFREDMYRIGYFALTLAPKEEVYICFTTDEKLVGTDLSALMGAEIQRIEDIKKGSGYQGFLADLVVASEQFIVQRSSVNGYSLIAGYPWFTDWGRDTMIAMRGLTIATGKQDLSRSILQTFLNYVDGGMLPNRFPDNNEAPEYNTIDATLWLFIALFEYYQKFSDTAFIREIFPKLTDIIQHHIHGTRYNIHVTPEGFLFGGEGVVQLTWMDARIGDYVVTPRHGCPVEINALWFNALTIYRFFSELIDTPLPKTSEEVKILDSLGFNFQRYFLNENGYLNDVVIPGEYTDSSIRPNQIYAVSLPFPLLEGKEAQKVVETVTDFLYTDYGLRSLAPEHPSFKPNYEGGIFERDSAYHQGTVWSFLIGEYLIAYLRVYGSNSKTKHDLLKAFTSLKKHFYEEDCLYGISEIFDGNNPAKGRGAFQQAWSVGMLLKVLIDNPGLIRE